MSQTWAEIDARPVGEVPAWHDVYGIPLVVRVLRQVGRLGWAGARVVVADDQAAAAIERALARDPAPASLAVEIVKPGAPPRPGAVPLLATGIYHKDALTEPAPQPVLVVRERADLRKARAALHLVNRKSLVHDGAYAYYFMRPLAKPIVHLLASTRVTANHVTIVACLFGVSSAICAGIGGRGNVILAGILFWLSGYCDLVDGGLARLRLQSSTFGEWLDSIGDEVSTYGLTAGIGIGMWRDGASHGWAVFGVAAAVLGALSVIPLYVDMHRRRLPIDTANFPWFYQTGSGATAKATGPFGHVIRFLGAFVRRDTSVAIMSLMLVLDLRWLVLGLFALGGAIALGVTIAHFVVTARRARGAAPT